VDEKREEKNKSIKEVSKRILHSPILCKGNAEYRFFFLSLSLSLFLFLSCLFFLFCACASILFRQKEEKTRWSPCFFKIKIKGQLFVRRAKRRKKAFKKKLNSN